MAVTTMRSNFASTGWRMAFANELIRLQPDLNPDAADEVSDAMYLRYAHLPAVEVARRYVDDDWAAVGDVKTA